MNVISLLTPKAQVDFLYEDYTVRQGSPGTGTMWELSPRVTFCGICWTRGTTASVPTKSIP